MLIADNTVPDENTSKRADTAEEPNLTKALNLIGRLLRCVLVWFIRLIAVVSHKHTTLLPSKS